MKFYYLKRKLIVWIYKNKEPYKTRRAERFAAKMARILDLYAKAKVGPTAAAAESLKGLAAAFGVVGRAIRLAKTHGDEFEYDCKKLGIIIEQQPGINYSELVCLQSNKNYKKHLGIYNGS